MFFVPVTRSNTSLLNAFDRLFDDSFDRVLSPPAVQAEGTRSPSIDVSESDRAYTLTVDLPGVAKEDVKVSIDGRRVDIQAQSRKETERKEGERVLYRERSLASYSRTLTLPSEVDTGDSVAKLDNGVLTLKLIKRSANGASQLRVN